MAWISACRTNYHQHFIYIYSGQVDAIRLYIIGQTHQNRWLPLEYIVQLSSFRSHLPFDFFLHMDPTPIHPSSHTNTFAFVVQLFSNMTTTRIYHYLPNIVLSWNAYDIFIDAFFIRNIGAIIYLLSIQFFCQPIPYRGIACHFLFICKSMLFI